MDMELEALLRSFVSRMVLYFAKVITLATGKQLVVRPVERKDVLTLLKVIKPAIDIPRDYYDIVGARLYAELLGWYRYRVRDHYCLAGQVDGILVGVVNGRMVSQILQMMLHFGRKEMRSYPETSFYGQSVITHPDFLGIHPTIDDPNEKAIYLPNQAVMVPYSITVPAQQFCIHPDPDNVIVVPGYVKSWPNRFEQRWDILSFDLAHHHVFPDCQGNYLWGVRRHPACRWSQLGFEFHIHAKSSLS